MKHNCVLPNLKRLRCFFSQFFNHPSAKKQQVRLISLFLIGFFIFFEKPCFAQGLPCLGVSTDCSGSNDPLVWASFKCIDANGETFSNLIIAGLLTNNGTAITLNGLDLTGVRRPIFFTPNGGIWGNQITGGAMLAPLSPYHSFRGIVVRGITQIQIGNAGQSQNVISNMKGHGFPPNFTLASAGVYVNNSSVNIVNSRFIGNGNSTVPFLKDAAITTENKGSTTFTGLGMDGQTVFEDCHVGMYFSNSSGNISFSKFLNNKYDVVNDGPPVQSAINNLFINTCNFDSFKEIAVYLKSFGAISLTTFEVKDSRFNDNNPT